MTLIRNSDEHRLLASLGFHSALGRSAQVKTVASDVNWTTQRTAAQLARFVEEGFAEQVGAGRYRITDAGHQVEREVRNSDPGGIPVNAAWMKKNAHRYRERFVLLYAGKLVGAGKSRKELEERFQGDPRLSEGLLVPLFSLSDIYGVEYFDEAAQRAR